MSTKLKTYYIRTFGCQMNEADSEKIANVFEAKGYLPAKSWKTADVVIINTCSVRQSAEDRVMGLVNNIRKLKIENSLPARNATQSVAGGEIGICKLKIILTGCMMRYTIHQLKRMLPDVDEFVKLKDLIGNYKLKIRNSKALAFVKIMEGCDNFCTYCVVPSARGRERSRPMEEIICEVKELVKREYKEITLLGQNVNSYGKKNLPNLPNQPNKSKFAKLLQELHKIKGLKKIKFLTSNPHDLTDDIIKAMKLPKIDRYLHLAVQSGDDEILRKMNRKYTAGEYLGLIAKIKKEIPEIEIGTDIIVGFPGETKKQFENTVALCKKVKFGIAFINKYSPRLDTPAYKLKDDIPIAEKKRRWQILNRLINSKH